MRLFILAGLALGHVSLASESESFREELLLRPALDGDVVAHLSFQTLSTSTQKHFHLFPRPIAELLEAHAVQELEVHLTRGVWRQRTWGPSPDAAPPGAQVSAWFDPRRVQDVDKAWTGLTNALAGQLCASLNFLYSTQTVSPLMSYQV